MGNSQSKKKEVKEEESPVYNTAFIYYDTKGNLRYGKKKFDPDNEVQLIMKAEDTEEEDGKLWNVVDSSWMNSWIAYAHIDKEISPNPGPCFNKRLIEFNEDENKYVMKSGLLPASKSWTGDYRRITPEAWKAFKSLYPESGPEITVKTSLGNKEVGLSMYDWIIEDIPSPAAQHKKKKKLNLMGFLSSKNKEGKEEGDKTTSQDSEVPLDNTRLSERPTEVRNPSVDSVRSSRGAKSEQYYDDIFFPKEKPLS